MEQNLVSSVSRVGVLGVMGGVDGIVIAPDGQQKLKEAERWPLKAPVLIELKVSNSNGLVLATYST